jgi:hypothetical protein
MSYEVEAFVRSAIVTYSNNLDYPYWAKKFAGSTQ